MSEIQAFLCLGEYAFPLLPSSLNRSTYLNQMFSVLFTESAGETADRNNGSISEVLLGGHAWTGIRRFIVVKQKRGFCFGW